MIEQAGFRFAQNVTADAQNRTSKKANFHNAVDNVWRSRFSG